MINAVDMARQIRDRQFEQAKQHEDWGKIEMEVEMVADAQILEEILRQVNQLTPEYRLRLIQRISASLLPFIPRQTTPLQFGKYKNNKMSTLEDFAVAEWHPTDDELNGA